MVPPPEVLGLPPFPGADHTTLSGFMWEMRWANWSVEERLYNLGFLAQEVKDGREPMLALRDDLRAFDAEIERPKYHGQPQRFLSEWDPRGPRKDRRVSEATLGAYAALEAPDASEEEIVEGLRFALVCAGNVCDEDDITSRLAKARTWADEVGRGPKSVAQYIAGSFEGISGETVRREYCPDGRIYSPWPAAEGSTSKDLQEPGLRVVAWMRRDMFADSSDESTRELDETRPLLRLGWLSLFDQMRR